MKTKKCSKCKIEKELSMFSKNKRNKDGLCFQCKECRSKISKKYRDNNIEKEKQRHKKYRDVNKDKIKKQSRKYYLEHIEERKIYNKIDWAENKEYYQKYRQENKERIREYKNSYCRKRRKNDVEYKILCNLRGRITHSIKHRKKSDSTEKLTGCTIAFLRKHLESQFTEGMNWDNYGTGLNGKGMQEWHIDHIKPCASFDLSKPEEQRKCFHYSNLQSLWAKENLIKGIKCYEN